MHDVRNFFFCLGLELHVHTDTRPQTLSMHESRAVRHGVLTANMV